MPEALLLAFAIFFSTTLLRAFPWPQQLATRKPLSCPTCLAGWAAIAAWLVMKGWQDPWPLGVLCAAAAGGALLIEAARTWLIRLEGNGAWLPPS